MEWLTKELRELYEKAKGYQQNQAPSPDYSTGRTDGFYEGVRYVFDKIAEQSNEPLTLEELRGMDGEPVFIMRIGSDEPTDRDWALVDLKHNMCRTLTGGMAIFELYGKSWLAYRRRPEEDHP